MSKSKLLTKISFAVIAIAFAIIGAPQIISNAQVVETNGVYQISGTEGSVELPAGAVVKIASDTAVSNIYCEGDLTLAGDGSSTLTIANESNGSAYMDGYPGVVAKGNIIIRDLNIVDRSKGAAIANVSGYSGDLRILNSNVSVENSGVTRMYSVKSTNGVFVSNSSVSIQSGYRECGVFAFGNISVTHSNVYVAGDGKYPIASDSQVILGREQLVAVPASATVGQIIDHRMSLSSRRISTIVSNNEAVHTNVRIIEATPFSITVVSGQASFVSGYQGETIQIAANIPAGKEFAYWSASSSVVFENSLDPMTTFKMVAQDVTITANFRDTIVSRFVTSSAFVTPSFVTPTAPVAQSTQAPVVNPSSGSSYSSSGSGGSGSGGSGGGGGSSAGGSSSEVAPTTAETEAPKVPAIIETIDPEDILPTIAPDYTEPVEVPDNSAVSEIDENTIKVVDTAEDGTSTQIILSDESLSYTKTNADGSVAIEAEYSIKGEDKLVLTSFKVKGKVTLPKTIEIDGEIYKVVAIDKGAFKDNSKITKVTVSKNITTIGANAFGGCNNLKTVVIQGVVKSIGANAFNNIDKNAVIYIKASFKQYRKMKILIKQAGVTGSIKFKRIK